MDTKNAGSIALLNDLFRQQGPQSGIAGRMFMTAGVNALPLEKRLLIAKMVQEQSVFDSGDDPYGQHDFGAFKLDGESIYWKIDYYADSNMGMGAEHPGDASVFRVLTILLASEY